MVYGGEICDLMREEQTKGYQFGAEGEKRENFMYGFRTCVEAVMSIIEED